LIPLAVYCSCTRLMAERMAGNVHERQMRGAQCWLGTEPGQLAVLVFKGVVAAADGYVSLNHLRAVFPADSGRAIRARGGLGYPLQIAHPGLPDTPVRARLNPCTLPISASYRCQSTPPPPPPLCWSHLVRNGASRVYDPE